MKVLPQFDFSIKSYVLSVEQLCTDFILRLIAQQKLSPQNESYTSSTVELTKKSDRGRFLQMFALSVNVVLVIGIENYSLTPIPFIKVGKTLKHGKSILALFYNHVLKSMIIFRYY